MTAIAWKDGILATDSRVTNNDHIVYEDNKKIFKFKHYVLAACGGSEVCAWFVAWLNSNFMISPTHPHDNESEAFLVDKKLKKLWVVWPNAMKEELDPRKIHTSGSVAAALKLLLVKGSTPTEAIKFIAKHNTGINGVVQKVKCW